MKTRLSHTIEMTEEEYKAQMQTVQNLLGTATNMVRWVLDSIEKDAVRDHELRKAEMAQQAEMAQTPEPTEAPEPAGDTNE
jgi:hypothetical protein